MTLLFFECFDLQFPRRGGEPGNAVNFRPVAVNPAHVRSMQPSECGCYVPGPGGAALTPYVTVDTGGSFLIHTLEPMPQLMERWQKALDGFPAKKADDSTRGSGSSSTGARSGNP